MQKLTPADLESAFEERVTKFRVLLPLAGNVPPGELERKVVEELERKLCWAFGTTYGMPYKRGARGLALLSRRLAFLFIENVGMPN